VPDFSSPKPLKKLAARSLGLQELYEEFSREIFSLPPFSLGFPSDTAQSAYDPSLCDITSEEAEMISRALQENSIFPENTRIRKRRKAWNARSLEVLYLTYF
jgi:dipeptidyl-peptidase-3